MQSYLYFPGCTLRTVATDFDVSAKACAHALGTDLKEMQGWLCCGAVYSNTSDNLMTQAGPNRILSRARTEGNSLVTLCAGCHNVLKRTSIQAKRNREKQEKINDFNEETFDGEVNVFHFLEVLRDFVGYDTIRGRVKAPLQGLPVGAYYGCLLLRPYREMQLDDPHRPTVIENLLESIGCSPVDYPSRTECCGSYLSVPTPETIERVSGAIVQSARSNGAKVIAVSCPLCKYNLELSQSHEPKPMPVVYFTQLLGLALGLSQQDVGLDDLHYQAIRGNLQAPMVKEA
jgi:heterodisulfide reductase subunit B